MSDVELHDVNNPESLDTVKCPALPRVPDFSSPLIARSKPFALDLTPENNNNTPFRSPRNFKDADSNPQSIETIKPQQSYLHQLGRPAGPKFEREDSGISMEYPNSSNSSTSSASWTGDSQFFIPKKTREIPTHERQCSVSKWLDLLPATPEEHSEVEDANEEVGTLSPSVEVGRGPMRRRKREWEKKERCASFDDDDIFSAVVR